MGQSLYGSFKVSLQKIEFSEFADASLFYLNETISSRYASESCMKILLILYYFPYSILHYYLT